LEVRDFSLRKENLKIGVRRIFLPREEVVLILPGFFQSKNTRIFKSLQKEISKFFDTACMDMPGHGNSSSFFTFGSKNEEEALNSVLDYLEGIYHKIGVLAFSLSGLATINSLAKRKAKKVVSLVLVSVPSDFSQIEFRFFSPSAIKLGLRSLDWNLGALLGFPFFKKEKPLENIQRIEFPILFLQGDSDPIIDKTHTFKLAQAHPGKQKVYIFRRGSHAEDLYRSYPEEFLEQVIDWFRRSLKNE